MRLLIVDDDVEIRRSLGQRLEESGHQVTVESDPDRALQRAATGSFEIILCNVRLPGTDGVTFLRRYRAAGGAALFIMISPPGSEEGAIAAMREGAHDWVQKPFRTEEVAWAIKKAEELKRLRHEVAERVAAVTSALAEFLPDWSFREPQGGLSLWAELPDADATGFCRLAREYGVEVLAGPITSADGGFDDHVRISLVGPPARLRTGVERLAEAWRAHVGGDRASRPGLHAVV